MLNLHFKRAQNPETHDDVLRVGTVETYKSASIIIPVVLTLRDIGHDLMAKGNIESIQHATFLRREISIFPAISAFILKNGDRLVMHTTDNAYPINKPAKAHHLHLSALAKDTELGAEPTVSLSLVRNIQGFKSFTGSLPLIVEKHGFSVQDSNNSDTWKRPLSSASPDKQGKTFIETMNDLIVLSEVYDIVQRAPTTSARRRPHP